MPHDYRRDPFIDADMSIVKVERHVIPATSPYVIALTEIPQKNNPSTTGVKVITSISGSTVTYGQTFSEVAASPSAGQYWPDYSTGADDDKNWNTGKLQFNSADAGKLVEVTYTGTGTLASVKSDRYPNWWLDRGDGSDGDFIPTANVTISGVKNYTSIYIASGITVTVDKAALIKCQNAFINYGVINVTVANTRTYPLNTATSFTNNVGNNAFFGSPGGNGGRNHGNANSYGTGGTSVDYSNLVATSHKEALTFGYYSVGGSGGAGGTNGNYLGGEGGRGAGCLYIVAQEIFNSGTITANGENGGAAYKTDAGTNNTAYAGGGGGGGGGLIFLCALRVVVGTTSTIGGAGGNRSSNDPGNSQSGVAGTDGATIVKELGVM